MTPSPGNVIRLGDGWKEVNTATRKQELGQHSPVTVGLKFMNFFFVVKDDSSAFPPSILEGGLKGMVEAGLTSMVEDLKLTADQKSTGSKGGKEGGSMIRRKGG